MIKRILALLLMSFFASAQPSISFTFDDGITSDYPGYSFETWNGKILNHLEKEQLKAIFFVTGSNKTSPKGQELLNSWANNGHRIANHTFTHPLYNSDKTSLEDLKLEIEQTDEIISKTETYIKLFRFPYLKEGNTPLKVDGIREYLNEIGYKNGHVTIDASDWYINDRLVKRLRANPDADISGFRDFYLKHLMQRANYYEKLAFQLSGRHIPHTILLHHNLSSSLFLGDLITHFKKSGWHTLDADLAYEDPIFELSPSHAGESLIWALAKDKNYPNLRYPAEDSRYERKEMDELGL